MMDVRLSILAPWQIARRPVRVENKARGQYPIAGSWNIFLATTAIPRTLAGLPTFCPITFHLFVSYSLMACSKAAL